jgi:protein-S-isoprenylcysteine O-methyltransferase Ste14
MIFNLTSIAWFLSEIVLMRMLRSNKADKQGTDKKSLPLLWIIFMASIALAVTVANSFRLPIGDQSLIPYMGLMMMWTGIILRLWIVRQLGRMFTVDVTIREGHQLKTDGPYKHLRHPSYGASYLTFIGFGFALNNWISLLLIAIPVFLGFRMRINVEEKVLEQQFGQEYQDYKTRTNAMIPMVY